MFEHRHKGHWTSQLHNSIRVSRQVAQTHRYDVAYKFCSSDEHKGTTAVTFFSFHYISPFFQKEYSPSLPSMPSHKIDRSLYELSCVKGFILCVQFKYKNNNVSILFTFIQKCGLEGIGKTVVEVVYKFLVTQALCANI